MLKNISLALALGLLTLCASPALSRCACENKNNLDKASQEAADAARRLPSEADRQLARDFQNKGLLVDAAQWYQSASKKAEAELATAQEQSKQTPASVTAAGVQQLALHSADVHREASSFLRQQNKLTDAASAWEQAIVAETVGETNTADLSNEYGTLARLYESAGKPAKAAEMYRKQITLLAASKGRYSTEASFAEAQYRRLTGKAAGSIARRS